MNMWSFHQAVPVTGGGGKKNTVGVVGGLKTEAHLKRGKKGADQSGENSTTALDCWVFPRGKQKKNASNTKGTPSASNNTQGNKRSCLRKE